MRYRVFGEVALLPEARDHRTRCGAGGSAPSWPCCSLPTADRSRRSGCSPTCGASRPGPAWAPCRSPCRGCVPTSSPTAPPATRPGCWSAPAGATRSWPGPTDVDGWQFESLADPRPRRPTTPPPRCALGEQATGGGPGRRTPTATPSCWPASGTGWRSCAPRSLERRAEDLLALGRDREALTVATDALGDNPYRERLWAAARARPLPRRTPGRGAGDAADASGSGSPTSSASTRPRRCSGLEQRLLRQDAGLLQEVTGGRAGAPGAGPGRAVTAPRAPVAGRRRGDRRPRAGRRADAPGCSTRLASGGPSRFWSVTGEPGIGKTRAVDDLLRLARRPGAADRGGPLPRSPGSPRRCGPGWPSSAALAGEGPAPEPLRPLLEDQPAEADRGAGTRLRLYDAVVDLVVGAATRARRSGRGAGGPAPGRRVVVAAAGPPGRPRHRRHPCSSS